MARKRNPVKTSRVQPSLSRETVAYLNELVRVGGYGNTATEVATYLIKRGVDDLLRVGLIGPGLKRKRAR